MKRFTVAPNLLVVVGLVLALVTVAYAQSLEKGLEDKPYAEGQGAQGAGSSVQAGPGEKGWVEGVAGAAGAFRAAGTVSQEAPSLASGEDKPYPEGEGGRAGSSVAAASAQDRGWPEGAAGSSGATRLEGVSLQEWLDIAADGDLPVLYAFSGVTDDGEQGSASRREATSIHCTNLNAENTQIEVQVYQWNGTDVYTGTVNMPPNRTFTFSTQNTTIYFDDVILGGSPGTDAIFQGSGRVLSSNSRVICTAQVLDPLNYPPVFVSAVELFRQ